VEETLKRILVEEGEYLSPGLAPGAAAEDAAVVVRAPLDREFRPRPRAGVLERHRVQRA
jgi:hypothetical protein